MVSDKTTFATAIELMTERFGKDTLIAVATRDGENIHNRIVDGFFAEDAFYIVGDARSNKMKQIARNPQVAIASPDWFNGHGIGENLGWVLKLQNATVRDYLRNAFEWYDEVNNEQDSNTCFLKITLTDGLLIKDHHAIRYQIDFTNKTAKVSENWGPFV